MIKKTIVVLACIAVATQIKSQDALVGKKIFQGNVMLSSQGVTIKPYSNPNQYSNTTNQSSSNKNLNMNLNGLFGKIDDEKNLNAYGFNLYINNQNNSSDYTQNQQNTKYKTLQIKVGPSFGFGKFVSISENLFYAPTSNFDLFGSYSKSTSFRQQSGFYDNTQSTKSFGIGTSISLSPLRLGYLWKEKIMLTASIGYIGASLNYESAVIENTQNFNTEKSLGSAFGINVNGGLTNSASFGVSYLFN
jgi:hypothetical protein